jgi:hypothetical protein
MNEMQKRPNHAYLGVDGLSDEEAKLYQAINTLRRSSDMSFESINTVLILASDKMYHDVLGATPELHQ